MSKTNTAWKKAQFPPGVKHKNKCWRCGRHLTFEIATVDHLRPLALGGSDAPHNKRLACFGCNHTRGSRPLTKDERRLAYGAQHEAR